VRNRQHGTAFPPYGHLETAIGFVAAFCTTVSYVPQVRKSWETGSTGDLSLKMILLLATGISMWVFYGVLKTDAVIILANGASLLFLGVLLFFKINEMRRGSPNTEEAAGGARGRGPVNPAANAL
jgi:MtN3 and saliva related transmembrane protein